MKYKQKLISLSLLRHQNSLVKLRKDRIIADLTKKLNEKTMALAAAEQRVEIMLRKELVESINS